MEGEVTCTRMAAVTLTLTVIVLGGENCGFSFRIIGVSSGENADFRRLELFGAFQWIFAPRKSSWLAWVKTRNQFGPSHTSPVPR